RDVARGVRVHRRSHDHRRLRGDRPGRDGGHAGTAPARKGRAVMRIETTLAEHTAWLRAKAIEARRAVSEVAALRDSPRVVLPRLEGRAFALAQAYGHATGQTTPAAVDEINKATAEENN